MLRWMDGFDSYGSAAELIPNWTTWAGGGGVATGRYGGKCLGASNVGGGTVIFPDYQNTWIVGANVKMAGGGGTFMGFSDTQYGFQATLSYDITTGRYYLYRGNATALLGVSRVFDLLNWHHIQWKVVCDSVHGSMVFRVNGVDEIVLNDINTQQFPQNTINYFQTPMVIYTNMYWDDMFLFDGQGSINNDILRTGEPRVESLIPTGTGSHIDFTPSTGAYNWATIDETSPNGDTDYNEAFPTGAYDLLTAPALSELTGTVYGVQTRLNAKRTNAGLRVLSPIVNLNGSNYVISSGITNAAYTWIQGMSELDPSTGAMWTLSGVNNAQFGYKIAY